MSPTVIWQTSSYFCLSIYVYRHPILYEQLSFGVREFDRYFLFGTAPPDDIILLSKVARHLKHLLLPCFSLLSRKKYHYIKFIFEKRRQKQNADPTTSHPLLHPLAHLSLHLQRLHARHPSTLHLLPNATRTRARLPLVSTLLTFHRPRLHRSQSRWRILRSTGATPLHQQRYF